MHWVRKWHPLLAYFSRLFTNLNKIYLKKKKLLFLINYACEINFLRHLFRNTNLTYHEKIWKRKMYLASNIIFNFFSLFYLAFCPFSAQTLIRLQKQRVPLRKSSPYSTSKMFNVLTPLFQNFWQKIISPHPILNTQQKRKNEKDESKNDDDNYKSFWNKKP